MWPFKKKNNKKVTFNFTELNQTDFLPHNFMQYPSEHEPLQNNTAFGNGDFGGAGASGTWDNNSSDSSNDFGGDSESGDFGGAGASGSWGNDSSDSSNDFGGDSESGDFGGGD